jgi:hypothetical protein
MEKEREFSEQEILDRAYERKNKVDFEFRGTQRLKQWILFITKTYLPKLFIPKATAIFSLLKKELWTYVCITLNPNKTI